jgi:hypothetical protein
MTQLGECTEYCGTVFGQIGPECADEGDAVFSCWLPSASMCLNEPPAECQSKVGRHGGVPGYVWLRPHRVLRGRRSGRPHRVRLLADVRDERAIDVLHAGRDRDLVRVLGQWE